MVQAKKHTRDKSGLDMFRPREADAVFSGHGGDRIIRTLKIILPALALVLLVLLLLWPVLQQQEVAFTLSYEDVETSDDKIRMVRPHYVGTDSAGRIFSVSAAEGIQDSPDDPRVYLAGISASFQLSDDKTAGASSDSGLFFPDRQYLLMEGQVSFDTSDGYLVEGRKVEVDLTQNMAWSDAPVSGSGPIGDFTAGNFRIFIDQQSVVFSKGVKMTLLPEGRKPEGRKKE